MKFIQPARVNGLAMNEPGRSLAPLTIVGPFSGDHGQAEFARQVRDETKLAGLPAVFVDVSLQRLASHQSVHIDGLSTTQGPVLFLLNPPEFVPLARQLGYSFFVERPTAALWWWEASNLPPDWIAAASLLDEVWAVTQYIRDQIAHSVGKALRAPLPATALAPRGPIDPSQTGARFLITFDYRSTVERKNPDGAVRAYLKAFPTPTPGVSLTVKTQAADRLPFESRRLRRLARRRSDILFIDRSLPRDELDKLMTDATCYLSLHRAEGLGLGLLEAMRMGKPVIATGFSGNLQFMPADYPLLVQWNPVKIRRGTPLYGRLGGTWAEPDLDHAALLLRSVVDDPQLARRAANMGIEHLEKMALSERFGAFVQQRFGALMAGRRPAADDPIWNHDLGAHRRGKFLARLEPPLRRLPNLHKFGMDLFFGRYSLRRR